MEDLAPLNWQVTLYTRKKGILHMFTTMLISSIFKSLTQKLDLANFQFQSIYYRLYSFFRPIVGQEETVFG